MLERKNSQTSQSHLSKICIKAKRKSNIKSPLTNQQTAYVQNRYIYERRLISVILDIYDKLSINGSLVTGDIEKNFDSLNHGFLLVVSKTFCFSNNFTE